MKLSPMSLFTYIFCFYSNIFYSCHQISKATEPPCFTILPHKSSKCIHFTRTASVCDPYQMRLGTREQMNANTAFIDGSQIYGSTLELAKNLRDLSRKYLIQNLINIYGLNN